MAVALAQVRVPYDTALPEDATVNTFTFITPGADVTPTQASAICTALRDFYGVIHTGSPNALASYWSVGVDLSLASCKVYDIGDTPPRAPIVEEFGGFGTTGTTAEPSELCGTLSFQGIRQSGQLQARRRGRIFFGPLASTALGSTYPIRLNANFIAAANAAMKALAAPIGVTDPIQWCVYSRVNQSAVNVDNGWVDNAIDIQRRRGEKANARTLWEL